MDSPSSGRKQPPKLKSIETSGSRTHSTQSSLASDLCPNCAGLEQGEGQFPGPWTQPQHMHSSSTTQTDEDGETIITSIQAKDVAAGIKRLPAGFYVAVHHSGFIWRTENRRLPPVGDIVEWTEPIPIPSSPSTTICFEVYASFEFQPMLGAGERLRKLTVTVKQLFDHSAKDIPFTLYLADREIVSPCSSILVTVQKQKCGSGNSLASLADSPHCPPTQTRGEQEDATNRGHNAISCYRKHGYKLDLERSVKEFEFALGICPMDHPCLAAAQSNLGMAKFILCQVENTNTPLEAVLGLYQNALAARPIGHVDRPSTLIQLAAVHLARFERGRDEVEGARAEALLHEAIKFSSTTSHEKQAANFMLQLNAIVGVDAAQAGSQSSVGQKSLRLTGEDLRILSIWMLRRFEQFGDLGDLQQAIAILEELIRSNPDRDDRYCQAVSNLGVALIYRFNILGKLSDLEDSISMKRNAVDLLHPGHPHKPGLLNNLGSSLTLRFRHLGELSSLEEAISKFRDAMDLAPHGHPFRSTCLNNIGNSFVLRFRRLGKYRDLDDAISSYMDANNFSPCGHPLKPTCLNNLGSSLILRFHHFGDLSDVEVAISICKEAVNLTPHGHPQKFARIHSLGNSFKARFDSFGEQRDLEEAISCYRSAVDLTPRGHPDKPVSLSNLSDSLRVRFERLGERSDMEEAISFGKSAVDLTPHDHPAKPGYLNNLANSLILHFKCLGELRNLECAIMVLRDAIDLTPHNHPDKVGFLNNLGMSLQARFERFGKLSDLHDAISGFEGAVHLTPQGHSMRPGYLNNLGSSLRARFERLGELGDLDDAISKHRNAVDLTPCGHPDEYTYLNNLGLALRVRFERLGEISDIENAILGFRKAIHLTPHGHIDKPSYLTNLGYALRIRFVYFEQLMDLEDAISVLRNAVDLTPYTHPYMPGYLNNLAISFRVRSEYLGELSDTDDAISRLKDAVNLTPHSHPHKHTYLHNLGTSFLARFKSVGEQSDLDDAISILRDAAYLTPDDHPHKPGHLVSLGNCLLTRFKYFEQPNDLQNAILLYSHAASVPIGPVKVRFHAAQRWISSALCIQHHSLLHAYSVAIGLLPQLAWMGLSLTHRYDELSQCADIVRDAAAAALDLDLPETAVEWLEKGRSIVWGELLQLRNSCEELSFAYPDRARRLRELSTALEHAGAAREKSLSALSEPTQSRAHYATESLVQEGDRHRTLAIERDKLLLEIRKLPGFERFLLQKDFSQLRASAHSGPVVILNAAESRCDALIVLRDVDRVIHVPLSKFTLKRCTDLQNKLRSIICNARAIRSDERDGKRVTLDGVRWESFLSPLWKCIVKPVLDALAFSTPEELSRVFWCPTGPFAFLPIHAAGFHDREYSQPGHKIYDFIVSSYVPTLSSLGLSPDPSDVPSDDLRLLSVCQPPTDGHPHLPGVAIELGRIKEVVENSPSACTTLLESTTGTVEEVLDQMKDADWVHFACHGIQDGADSGLCLANQRRLKLRDIIALSRTRGGLAFLSACQTATGDQHLSDEAIHIAAGMLFAGYGGVVGTMWSISDRIAPDVARDVYAYLFRNDRRPDYRDAARALHEAVGCLRDRGVPFVEWLPFIHVGL